VIVSCFQDEWLLRIFENTPAFYYFLGLHILSIKQSTLGLMIARSRIDD